MEMRENRGKLKMEHRKLTAILLSIFVVTMAFGQTYLINQTFVTVPPTDWTNGATAPTHGTTGYDDANSLLFSENSSLTSIVTPAVTDPDRITFYHRKSNNAGYGDFTVYSGPSVTGPWTSVVSITSFSQTYTQSATELSLSSGTYYFKLERSNSNKKDLYIDVFQVTKSIVPSTSSLIDFTYEQSNGPSDEQSFTVSGGDLTANITLTAPSNYEISESSGTGFGSNITLTQSGGIVSSTPIYVRLISGLSPGPYDDEDITIISTGKISKTVTCSGFVGPWVLNVKVFIEGGM